MLRNRLIIGVAVLVLLGAIAGCGGDLERTVEETIAVSEQPAEEANVDLEQPAEETNTLTLKGYVIVDAYRYDAATGTYIHFYHDESSNLVVDIGKEQIEAQLGIGGAANDDPSNWISLSSDTGTPAAGWLVIPAEINTAGGLDRAQGTYGSTGTGAWEITKQFTADTTYTDVQLTGLHWGDIGTNNLLAANEFTTPVTLNNGDTLTVTWQLSVSGA